jgi:hypothetical protein
MEVADDTCRGRLHLGNRRTEHEFSATDAEFDLITSYFRAPDEDEGPQIEIHRLGVVASHGSDRSQPIVD